MLEVVVQSWHSWYCSEAAVKILVGMLYGRQQICKSIRDRDERDDGWTVSVIFRRRFV